MRKVSISLLAVVTATLGILAVNQPAQAAGANYVALGDSISAGTGGGYYGFSGYCYRSANSYPKLYQGGHTLNSFSFPACAGATTDNVKNNQLGSLNSSTTLVTISIGGNDTGFADVMNKCTNGTDQECVDRVNQAKWEVNNVLPGKLNSTYSAIKSKAPNARVIVMGYPRLFVSGTASCFMSYTKRTSLNSLSDSLASVISSRAAAAGFTYVDVRTAFSSHGICSSDPWIKGIVTGTYWIESFHPNANGYRYGYYNSLLSATG